MKRDAKDALGQDLQEDELNVETVGGELFVANHRDKLHGAVNCQHAAIIGHGSLSADQAEYSHLSTHVIGVYIQVIEFSP